MQGRASALARRYAVTGACAQPHTYDSVQARRRQHQAYISPVLRLHGAAAEGEGAGDELAHKGLHVVAQA